jgi:hypothetical protein
MRVWCLLYMTLCTLITRLFDTDPELEGMEVSATTLDDLGLSLSDLEGLLEKQEAGSQAGEPLELTLMLQLYPDGREEEEEPN